MRQSIQQLQSLFDRINEGTQRRRRVYGILGRAEPDGSVTVRVAGDPRRAHVRVQGEQATTTAYHRGVVNLDSGAGQPVIMWREEGELYIEGYDTAFADESQITQVYARSNNNVPAVFDRFSSDTGGIRSALYLAHITSDDMVDPFGVTIQFAIEDDAGERHTVGFAGFERRGADDTGALHVDVMDGGTPVRAFEVLASGRVRLPVSAPPASASAAGTVGEIAWDGDFLYICVDVDTWKRAALSSW